MNSHIIISCEFSPRSDQCLDRIEYIEREIVFSDISLCFRIEIMNGYSRLSDIVPLARTICDKLLDVVINSSKEEKNPVSCRKGCATCCSYLVPLSMPEVFRLRSEFTSMPTDDCVSILKSCIFAARKILKQDATGSETHGNDKLKCISEWYSSLNIQCPFLSHGECTIYEQRPLACREYFVTSPPGWCQNGNMQNSHIVRLPVSIAEVLGEFAAKIEESEEDAVILPLALVGMDEFNERNYKTWPAAEMIHLFLDILEQSAKKQTETLDMQV